MFRGVAGQEGNPLESFEVEQRRVSPKHLFRETPVSTLAAYDNIPPYQKVRNAFERCRKEKKSRPGFMRTYPEGWLTGQSLREVKSSLAFVASATYVAERRLISAAPRAPNALDDCLGCLLSAVPRVSRHVW